MSDTPAKLGRPSIYTEELANTIAHRLSEGESIRRICAADDMPDRATVYRWLDENKSFRDRIVRAQGMKAEVFADQYEALTMKTIKCEIDSKAARVAMHGLETLARWHAPTKYGNNIEQRDTASSGGVTVRVVLDKDGDGTESA